MAGKLWTVGEVQWEATGADPHRLIDRVRQAGIPCRDFCVRETSEGAALTAWCPARDYRAIRPLVRRTGLRVRVRRKAGWAFRLRPLRKRTGLPIGAVLALMLLAWMSGRIWVVETPDTLSATLTDAIPPFLSSQGVALGRAWNALSPNDIEFQALQHLPGIAALHVNMEGCIAHVEVIERAFGEEVKPPDIRLSNIVAARDGHILTLSVLSGQPAVKAGSGVTEGTLLISGVVDTSVGPLLHRAQGVVLAETERTLTAEVPFRQTVIRPGGTVLQQTTLSMFGFPVPLYTPIAIPKHAEAITQRQALWLWGTELPLSLTRRHIRLPVSETVTHTEKEARGLALASLQEQEETVLAGADIKRRTLRDESDETVFRIVAEYRCVEDIAREVVVEIHDEAEP
ncbi:MAG: sporulation protein YqfD [Clostridia bacterium]|nr:sporulation protein YqfD [Clostridia bacterium]